MKQILLSLLVIVFYVACSGTDDKKIDSAVIDSALAAKNKGGREMDSVQTVLIGTFEGILPCADCQGIKTELALYQDAANSENNTYTLKETYLGNQTGDTSFSSSGKWDILRGIKGNPDAIVYFLNYDEPEESRYFLKRSKDSILMLDKEQQIISSSLNYGLVRRK